MWAKCSILRRGPVETEILNTVVRFFYFSIRLLGSCTWYLPITGCRWFSPYWICTSGKGEALTECACQHHCLQKIIYIDSGWWTLCKLGVMFGFFLPIPLVSQGKFNGGLWNTCRRESKCKSSSRVQPPRRYYWPVNIVKYFLFYKALNYSPEIKILFLLLCNKLNSTALTPSCSNYLWGIKVLGASVPPLTHERQHDVVKLIFLRNVQHLLSVADGK